MKCCNYYQSVVVRCRSLTMKHFELFLIKYMVNTYQMRYDTLLGENVNGKVTNIHKVIKKLLFKIILTNTSATIFCL